jgi:hypothetical protein
MRVLAASRGRGAASAARASSLVLQPRPRAEDLPDALVADCGERLVRLLFSAKNCTSIETPDTPELFDGFRCGAMIEQARLRLISRRGRTFRTGFLSLRNCRPTWQAPTRCSTTK